MFGYVFGFAFYVFFTDFTMMMNYQYNHHRANHLKQMLIRGTLQYLILDLLKVILYFVWWSLNHLLNIVGTTFQPTTKQIAVLWWGEDSHTRENTPVFLGESLHLKVPENDGCGCGWL